MNALASASLDKHSMNELQFLALIVDDQKTSTAALTTMLERRDVDCLHAATLDEATNLLEKFCPHLLIVDINMGPHLSGLDWLAKVRKSDFAEIPAIILTGSSDVQTVKDSSLLGIVDYIVKPSNPSVMAKKIIDMKALLTHQKLYFLNIEANPFSVQVHLAMHIWAVSETGFCVSSHIANRHPLAFMNPQSSLFAEMEVTPLKKLTLFNYQKEMHWTTSYPVRNFCVATGWTESDLQKVRLWIRREHLGRNF
jgi:CheY-like chemotaxis protein